MKTKIFFIFIFFFLGLGISQAVNVPVSTDLSPILSWCSSSSCNVGTGFSVVKDIAGGIIKYFTYIAGLAGVLFIVINGILYSMSWMDDGLKSSAKDRIKKMLIWLVLLMLSGVILNAIAPWIYK